MATRKSKKSSVELAVPVSYRLQFYTVFIAFGVAVLQSLMFITTSWSQSFSNNRFGNMFPFLVSSIIFPLVVFLIAYATSRKYPAPISRWFIAVLKAVLVVMAYTVIQLVWQWITISYYRSSKGSGNGVPPAWITSSWSVYVSMLVVVAGMVYVASRQKLRR
jgi:hypothetical protein